jgi:hypothetical protein
MQTFLPEVDFARSARALDRQRLGKQRVEVMQIAKALTAGGGWANHPAVRMWRGYELALGRYGISICHEWLRRGYRDTCLAKIVALTGADPSPPMPAWIGDEAFHLAHRSNLVRKNPDHYGRLWPGVPDDLPYVWPV